MTPGEVGRDLREMGYMPEFVDDEPRHYFDAVDDHWYGRCVGRAYFEELHR